MIFCSQFPTFDIVWIFWANYWTPCDWASRRCKGHLELCENLRWFLWWCLHKWSNANHFNIKHGKTLYFTYHYCIHLYFDIVHYLFVRLHFATPIQITSGDGLNPKKDSGGRRWPSLPPHGMVPQAEFLRTLTYNAEQYSSFKGPWWSHYLVTFKGTFLFLITTNQSNILQYVKLCKQQSQFKTKDIVLCAF